jgi:hypothetical protein
VREIFFSVASPRSSILSRVVSCQEGGAFKTKVITTISTSRLSSKEVPEVPSILESVLDHIFVFLDRTLSALLRTVRTHLLFRTLSTKIDSIMYYCLRNKPYPSLASSSSSSSASASFSPPRKSKNSISSSFSSDL